ncbi:hypothetical protein MJD09_15220 [bacterium]|nr:hypothetical protein [bacterium]
MSKEKAQNGQRNYEVSDAKFRSIALSGLLLAAVTVIAMVAMKGLFGFFQSQRDQVQVAASPITAPAQPANAPRLRILPEIDFQEFSARSDSVTNSYGWVVKEAGVVRIPIERAMELTLKRGLPVRPVGTVSPPARPRGQR